MENRCCVLGCLQTYNDGVRLHEFPFNKKFLLPIWVMATKRSDWLPTVESRICGRHFCIADYEGGDRNNKLKSIACPVITNSNNEIDIEDDIVSDSNSSTSDINFSDIDSIDSNDLPDTPNTSDMKFSDDDSILNTSFDSNSNDTIGLENEVYEDNKSIYELDAVSLSSSVTSFGNNDVNNQCAVVLCNTNARNQFEKLFFINFPKDNLPLCDSWWKLCGRIDKFDPSLKICSIHFNPNDFTNVNIRRDGMLYRQTILKDNTIVPTMYLLSHEYLKFNRKRKKKNVIDTNNIETQKPTEKCGIPSCKKTCLKDDKRTLFFKFPLENKLRVNEWVNNMGCPNWQPIETDRICSDHFENDDIMKVKNGYELCNNAIPSISPKNMFVMHFEDHSIKNHDIEYDFGSLDEDILMVKEKKRKTINENLLGTFKNNVKYQHPKQNEKESFIVKNSTERKYNKDNFSGLDNNEELLYTKNNIENLTKQYLESFVREIAEEKEATNENSNNKNVDLEYVYMDILNNENPIEAQETIDTNKYLRNVHKSKGTSKTIENKSVNISTIRTNGKISCKTSTSEAIKVSYIESTNINICEDTNIIPKSKNNGNVQDYIYLDMLNGDDVDKFLSFEKKCISKNNRKKIPELLETNIKKKEIPESIIYDKDLTECYGEMLPAYCDSNCQFMCYYSIPSPQRRQFYEEFQMLPNVTEQNCKITQLVQLRMIRKGDSSFESCPIFHLIINNKLVKVCRTFFKNTLGISEHRIDAVLKPINYSWYSDRDTALSINEPKNLNVINEPIEMTDFIKESLIPLDKDYNLYEPESDTEVSLDNVPIEEYEKVILYMKGIPRVLSSYQIPGELGKQYFETSICLEYMYKMFSENYLKNKIPPPYTKRQFKKIYNQYMKTFLKII